MTLPMDNIFRTLPKPSRISLVSLALLWCLALLPVRLEGQCTLQPQGPVSFEPRPLGAPRPVTLSSGFNYALSLYQNGGGGPRRLLMAEAFGYSVLDLSSPANPTALYYHDDRIPGGGPNSVTHHGDGQSNISTIAVSPDGQRAAFSTGGPAAPFNTVVGSPDGVNGFTLHGDFYPDRAGGTLIQHSGARYIAYSMTSIGVTAIDVTNLPSGFLKPLSMAASETTGWPGGSLASLAGNYILYMTDGIQVVDASLPGPAGSITASYPRTKITSADFGASGRTIAYYSAAVDPADATKLWVLAEFNALRGENSPSYGLLYVTSSLAKVPAGPIWRVPSQAGEVWWANPGVSSALIPSNGSLFVLMWAQRALPSLLFELYSTTAAAWGEVNSSASPGVFDIPTALYGNFSASYPMSGFSADTSIYAYLPTGSSAYVIPMSCVSQNVPAVASMTVANSAGARLNSGDTVFLGDQITITPSVSPSPASQPLTGFGWNFDFDFHASEEAGLPGLPGLPPPAHISAPDRGLSSILPPLPFTLVGPCDPRAGGTPESGAGCWTSVTTNAASGGPDFPSAFPEPGTSAPLKLAFEANNALGSAGLSTFKLIWTVPAAKLQSTQVLSAQPLVSGSDGHPTATGFKWYFGLTPTTLALAAGCSGPTCVPTFDTKGTYYYWLTASYANGYVTPDYNATTNVGQPYTVTDFAPAFTVNGSANGPITAIINQSLSVVNSSQRGAGIAATYQYSLCEILSGQTSCTDLYKDWPTPPMIDPPSNSSPSTATIPVPGTAGTWALKILVKYTGGQANWPDPAVAAFFQLDVKDVLPLAVTVSVDPLTAPVGQRVTFSCNATGGLGSYTYLWHSPLLNPIPVGTQQTYLTTSAVAGPVAAFCTVTDSQPSAQPVTVGNSATFTGGSLPPQPPSGGNLSVNVTVSPNPGTVNQTVTFSCNAAGGSPPYNYQWRSPSNSTFVLPGSSRSFPTSSPSATTISAACTATDSASVSGSGVASVTITAPVVAAPTCANVDFKIKDAASGELVALTGQLGIFFYSVRAGQALSFEPTATFSSYLWDFGGGETSTQAQATHTYAAAGQFAVSLTVEGNSSCKKAYSLTVTGASGAFTAAYEDASSIDYSAVTAFKNIVFTSSDLPSQVDSYAWEFSDGGTATDRNPTHAFSAAAGTANVTHTVKLTVTREAQSASTTRTFTIISPPEPPKWFVAGMAYAKGAIEGTVWQSDVTILNPHPTLSATYSLALLDGRNPVNPADLAWKKIDLGAQQSQSLSNLIKDFFEKPLGSFGALIVRGDVAPVPPTITSRTFNNGDPTKGSFGLSVPSTHTSSGSPPLGSTAPQLLIGLRDDDVAYTNIGFVNLISTDWSHAHVAFFDAAGAPLGLLNVDVPPYGVTQLDKPLTKAAIGGGLGLPSSSLYRVEVTVDEGGAVYPYATVIDAKSTDAIVVTPTVAPSSSYLIPGIVRQTGRNGERFRSRVTVSNPSAFSRRVRVTLAYVPCDGDACGTASSLVGDFNMSPGQTQSWDDFVKVWLNAFDHSDASDATDYKFSYVNVEPAPEDPVTDPLLVLGETYNETLNSSGRVGFQIPGYTSADGAGAAAAGKRLILTGLTSTTASSETSYRTNLALFAVAGATDRWCTVHVYSPDGKELRDPIRVPVVAFTSLDDKTLFGGASGVGYSIVVDNIEAGVTVGGYATIIDNTSGDATFVKAEPAP